VILQDMKNPVSNGRLGPPTLTERIRNNGAGISMVLPQIRLMRNGNVELTSAAKPCPGQTLGTLFVILG